MTSGQFYSIDIDSVEVRRDERQRRELVNIPILADSLRRLGLIHPIVITRDFVLVSGERRLAAARSIGWTNISVQYVDELEPEVLQAIELEENIKRSDLTWQEEVESVLKYHLLRKSSNGEWTQAQTGEALGISQNRISELLMVGEEVKKGNTKILDAPKLSTAEGIVRRANERKDQQIIDSIKSDAGLDHEGPPKETILVTNFNDWIKTHELPKFNFIHCDFPYGVNADTFNQGAAPAHGGYADTPEVWDELMNSLEFTTRNLTTQQCHLMFWFAMRKENRRLYEPTIVRLEQMGWNINPLPLIWMKSDGAGIIPDPERGPRQIYETCLFGSKGDRKIVRASANAYAAPSVRDKHMSEKPEAMLRFFFGMFIDENSIVLDPTCGSGAALRAAESMGAKFTLGLELDPEFADRAREALKRSRALRRATEKVT